MKIIIEGRPQKKRVLCGRCKSCGCVFTVEPEECTKLDWSNGTKSFTIGCPNCKNIVEPEWEDEDKIKPDYWQDN